MKQCVSLFSCAGFGDLGLQKADIHTISACEIIKERAELLRQNFPLTHIFNGDIWDLQNDIIEHAKQKLNGNELYMIIVSAPCQGASSNGIGRIQNQIKKGKREKDDPRNRLIIPAINIIKTLQPKYILIENVSGMRHTQIINESDEYETIFSILHRQLENYVIRSSILNTADFGVPQNRKRLITIGIKYMYTDEKREKDFFHEKSFLHPKQTHGFEEKPHISMQRCFSHLSALDAKYNLYDAKDPFHRIPKWNDMQYFCMQHTPEGQTAFENTMCTNCNKYTKDLKEVFCKNCGNILPKPVLQKHGTFRVINAFKTAYRRMSMNKPANALTTNSGVISSDVKGHPIENRVLSLREIMIIASIGYYDGNEQLFEYNFYNSNDKLIREVLGECIPPLLTFKIAKHLDLIS